jgi:hypothetical protein
MWYHYVMLALGAWFVGSIIWRYAAPSSALEKGLIWSTTGLVMNSIWFLGGLYLLWAGYSGAMAPAVVGGRRK